MLFWWQYGAISALQPHIDLTSTAINVSGASAGACTAALAACGVRGDAALACAEELALRAGVFERPLGLAGLWGGLVRKWLTALLPHDAHVRCNGRVHISLLEVFPWRRRLVSEFNTHTALVDAVMASVHVPFFMDGLPFALHRGRPCIDAGVGASQAELLPRATGLHPTEGTREAVWSDLAARGLDRANAGQLSALCAGNVVTLCYSHEPELASLRRADLLKLQSLDGVRELSRRGADFALRKYVPLLQQAGLQQHPRSGAKPNGGGEDLNATMLTGRPGGMHQLFTAHAAAPDLRIVDSSTQRIHER